MKAPVAALKAARESRPGGRINLQESQSTTAATRQIRLLHASKNLQQVRGLGVLHGRLSRRFLALAEALVEVGVDCGHEALELAVEKVVGADDDLMLDLNAL